MMKKTKLARAVALAMTGTALSLGAVSNASAHNMYNKFVGANDSSTDGWVYGATNANGAPPYPTATPGFTGVTLPATTPFGYDGKGWVNWAAAIHNFGSTTISDANAGFDADLDTNKGSWNDGGGTGFGSPQGWAHNTDIGLLKADVTGYVTLKVTNTEGTWSNYGITVFQGMDTAATAFANHHGSWNCPTCTPGATPYNSNNPFGLTGLTYLTHDATVDSTNGLTFLAQAGQVYSIFLGGNEFGSVFSPTADYSLSITTTAVPVPAAVWLFGSALAGLGIIGRRKERTLVA